MRIYLCCLVAVYAILFSGCSPGGGGGGGGSSDDQVSKPPPVAYPVYWVLHRPINPEILGSLTVVQIAEKRFRGSLTAPWGNWDMTTSYPIPYIVSTAVTTSTGENIDIAFTDGSASSEKIRIEIYARGLGGGRIVGWAFRSSVTAAPIAPNGRG